MSHVGSVMIPVVDGEIRIHALRQVLTTLPQQAQRVCAGFAETVDGFLRDRRT